MMITALTALSMPVSSAHGEIISSYPKQFANVNPIPTQVWIEFDGNLQTLAGQQINTIEIIDSTGYAMNTGDPVISGGRITTQLSDQSAPGVFTVKYRIVSEDGHPVEGSYTFNASPDYAEAVPTTTAYLEKKSSLNVGGIVMIVFLAIFAIGFFAKRKNEKK
jgi:methionine-rich copper-binding protein CopC